MLRPLLVGEAPNAGAYAANHSPLFPFPERASGGRLQRLIGTDRGAYLCLFDRFNVSAVASEARYTGLCMIEGGLLMDRRTLLLGKRVWAAFFGRPDVEPLCWYMMKTPAGLIREVLRGKRHPGLVALLPHPSGRNTWYNAPGNTEKARGFLAGLREPLPPFEEIEP